MTNLTPPKQFHNTDPQHFLVIIILIPMYLLTLDFTMIMINVYYIVII